MLACDKNRVVTRLNADDRLGLDRSEAVAQRKAAGSADRGAVLLLGLLIAVDRIIEIMGEIVDQLHRAVDAVEAQRQLPRAYGLIEAHAEAVAERFAVVSRVQRAEAPDQPRLHRALWLV